MRRFTAASSERIYVGSTGLGGFDWRWGTIAAVVHFPTLSGAETIVAFNDSNAADFYMNSSNSALRLYDGATGSDSLGPTISAGVTYVCGVSKATGTVTPRFHVYTATTGVWSHSDGASTVADSAQTTSIGIGSFADASASDALNGELGAVAAWPSWSMSDQEFERLARGNWASRSPGLLVEFISAQDSVGDLPRALGRHRVAQTSRTGTTLGAAAKPAGWRPSVQSRRR